MILALGFKMDFLSSLQAAPSLSISVLTIFNVLVIFGILCGIAVFVASRGEVRERQRIEGFEFIHEVQPLSLYESIEFYYLF